MVAAMFSVRIHGRGGQGVVTAAELLSAAAFLDGAHAQAFPSFGSERTGAPVVAFCRIDDRLIRVREPIVAPDALIVQDTTLLHQVDVSAACAPRSARAARSRWNRRRRDGHRDRTKWVYDFAEGSREMRELLGGKGAGIAEMTRYSARSWSPRASRSPPTACVAYMRRRPQRARRAREARCDEAIARLEAARGRRLGDAEDPLLVSVRSGARDSMPGMMDRS